MHNVTPRRVQLTRRRLLQLTGVTATAVAAADRAGGRIVSAAPLLRRQETPSGELTIGFDADDYRIDPPERANVGYYPLNTNIFESLVRLTPDY